MLAINLALRPEISQPFPGLRPFDVEDAFLFFGREKHTQELLGRLARSRFLAVVGSSGGGKSSLVRAGLIPALFRGYLVGATTRWRIAVMRPGNSPFTELAAALAHPKALDLSSGELGSMLKSSSFGLISAVEAAYFTPGESLLLVIDQFEEIFRFASERRGTDSSGDALLFVASILEAVDQVEVPIYVVLTMRTDFLGDCTQFPGLPEALNQSQYLIPRLSREQRRDAIERPIDVAGDEIEPYLVQQILNDMSNDPDQLPVMQHALARTYSLFKRRGAQGALSLEEYRGAGGSAFALNEHADSLYNSFSEEDRGWTRKLFRCLAKAEQGREVRRPMRLDRILSVTGAADERSRLSLNHVIEVFSSPENALIFVTAGNAPNERIVDISHESLIRKWKLLSRWTKEEAESAEWFADLWRDAKRQAVGQADFWIDPELVRVLALTVRDNWSPAWAELYGCSGPEAFGQVENFLNKSKRKRLKRRLTIYFGAGLLAVSLLLALFAVEQYRNLRVAKTRLVALTGEQRRSQRNVELLEAQRRVATNDRDKLRIDAQIAAERANLVESLRRDNQLLQKENSDLKANAKGADPAAKKPNPAIELLEKQIAELAPKAQQIDTLRKRLPGVDLVNLPEIVQERDRLKQEAATLSKQQLPPMPAHEVEPNTPPSSDSGPKNPVGPESTQSEGMVSSLVEARDYVLSNANPLVVTNTGFTLLLKPMGFAPLTAELYLVSAKDEIKRMQLDSLVTGFKAVMSKCKLELSEDAQGHAFYCVPVVRSNAIKGRLQVATFFAKGHRYSISISDFNQNSRSFNARVAPAR